MKILSNFDQAITEALQRNVKNRMNFKVGTRLLRLRISRGWNTGRRGATCISYCLMRCYKHVEE